MLETLGILRARDRPTLRVATFSRRNWNVLVTPRTGPALLVKQGVGSGREDLSNEASACRRLANVTGNGPAVPAVRHHDAVRNVLILETLRDARDLWAHTRRAGRVSVRVAAQVGTTLGRLHRTSRDPGEPADSIGTLEPPSVFDLTAPAIERYAEMSAANVRLVRLLQSDPAFAPLMSILAATWRPDALIHNDMKWENVLVAGPRVQLVDFEMAGVGDPAWDVGAALASYVVAWVRSIPATDDPEATSADLAAASPFPIERSWPALRALWTAYGTANGGTAPSAGRTLLERSVSFSGARLIQAAHDLSAESWNLDPRMARLAQVGMNVLRDPARAARALMGLAFDGT